MSQADNSAFARAALWAGCLFLATPLLTGAGSTMPVPAGLQVPLILKVLTYDRNINSKGQELKIGVIYNPDDAQSSKVKDEIITILEQFSSKTVKKLPIRYIALEYRSQMEFEAAVRSSAANVFYIAPGIARELAAVLRISQINRIITTTGVPDYVEQGVAVGIGVRQDKPHILIHLPGSKSSGCEFDASLLRIADVVR